jgi:hypothetical protein
VRAQAAGWATFLNRIVSGTIAMTYLRCEGGWMYRQPPSRALGSPPTWEMPGR